MKRTLYISVLLFLLPQTILAHGVVRFINGQWFDGRGFSQQTFYSVDGLLRTIADASQVTATIDLGGGFVIPPFGDAHTHEFTTADARTIDRFLSAGIFYAKNPNAVARLLPDVRAVVNKRDSVDVVWAAGGVTAPGGHPIQIFAHLAEKLGPMENEAYFVVASPADVDSNWNRIRGAGGDFIKAYLEHVEEYEERKNDPGYFGRRGLSASTLQRLIARAHAERISVTVHVNSAADFRAAVLAGADEIAHLPLEKLEPADAKLAADRNVVVVTTTVSHRPVDAAVDIDAVHRHNLTLLGKAGVRLVLGTDSGRDVIDEAEQVRRLGSFDKATMLELLTGETPRAIFPARKIGRLADGYEANFLVLAANPLSESDALRKILRRVKNGHVLSPASSKRGIATEIGHVLQRDGLERAIDEYRRLRRERVDSFDFSETQLNALGYHLLKEKKIDQAIAIFQLNIEFFGRSSNAHDSLGEAYAARGDKALAIASYSTAVEIDPKNENARKMLAKLGE